jgi:hypothetical protein
MAAISRNRSSGVSSSSVVGMGTPFGAHRPQRVIPGPKRTSKPAEKRTSGFISFLSQSKSPN